MKQSRNYEVLPSTTQNYVVLEKQPQPMKVIRVPPTVPRRKSQGGHSGGSEEKTQWKSQRSLRSAKYLPGLVSGISHPVAPDSMVCSDTVESKHCNAQSLQYEYINYHRLTGKCLINAREMLPHRSLPSRY